MGQEQSAPSWGSTWPTRGCGAVLSSQPDSLSWICLPSAALPLLGGSQVCPVGKPAPAGTETQCGVPPWATNYMGRYSGGVRASGSLNRSDLVRPGSQLPKSSWWKPESKGNTHQNKTSYILWKSHSQEQQITFFGQINGYSLCRWQVTKKDDHPVQQNGTPLSCKTDTVEDIPGSPLL